MSVELWFDTDSEDEEEYANLAVERRRIRDNSNPLDQTEKSISKEIFKYLREINAIKLGFYAKTGFPGVIGCVDGTHVSIIPPARDKHLYYNRKGFHSLNVMLVCDHNLVIRYLDANHPGSSHDSFVWNGSSLNQLLSQRYENGERNSWGDAGYPLTPFLITPFRTGSSTTDRQTRFNEVHSKTRITVERSIGMAKNTFRCLLGARQLYYKPEKATQIVNVCNLRIKHKMDYDEPELQDGEGDAELHGMDGNQHDASMIREEIMNNIL
ncbi:putative nuclease HARBI1 [Topomyia yanbarensis]|uniref:putative nuclease HARBI1 n=1 Tax=Topomyia yanbarensis TaxID=2498891 RepID=UPI00273A758B|nr:putative nuclease HARBI1 [Topomyia yanbarensis]